ncbi:MAG: hypothetical protein SO238_01555 [Treponema sp.]|nr:hypothetical protein [Treponema sp.]
MKKKLLLLVFLMISHLIMAQEKTRVGVLKGACAIPFTYILANPLYEFTYYNSADEIAKAIKAGLIDVTNISSVAAEKLVIQLKGQVSVAAVTSNTGFCIITSDGDLTSFSGLLGKQVHIVKDSLADKLFSFLLDKNSIPVRSDEVGVEIVYDDNNSEIIAGLNSGLYEYAVLAEPYISSVLTNSKRKYAAIDLQDEYQKIYGSDKVIPQTVLLVLSQFENNYTSDYVRLKYDIQNSIRKVKSQPVDAANVLNENKIGVSPFYSAKIISKLFLCYSENTKSDFSLSLGM